MKQLLTAYYWDSCHLRSLIKEKHKGQYLRHSRNCSDESTFNTQAAELKGLNAPRGFLQELSRRPWEGIGLISLRQNQHLMIEET